MEKMTWKIEHGPACLVGYPCEECKKSKEVPVMEEVINQFISKNSKTGLNTNLISDGYHTFGELYDHRIRLFITLCRVVSELGRETVWIKPVENGWFIMGISTKKGKQISYHLPEKYFQECDEIAVHFPPDFDGHTSVDVLERLKNFDFGF